MSFLEYKKHTIRISGDLDWRAIVSIQAERILQKAIEGTVTGVLFHT